MMTRMKTGKPVYTVVVTLRNEQNNNADLASLIECLRYAQLLTISDVHNTFDDSFENTFKIHCPKGMDSEKWSEQNAERMRSFGWHAYQSIEER